MVWKVGAGCFQTTGEGMLKPSQTIFMTKLSLQKA